MGRKYTDNALTTLAGALAIGGTTLTVLTGKGDNFPSIAGRGAAGSALDYFVITMEDAAGNREKIRVEERTAASDVLGSAGYPLARGYDGTAPMAWAAGDLVDLRIERKGIQEELTDLVAAGAPARLFGLKASTSSGLNYGYYGGQMLVAGVLTTIPDGLIALTLSATNFVEYDSAGVVSKNTVGFSADKSPIAEVVTNATLITSITDRRRAVSTSAFISTVLDDTTQAAARQTLGAVGLTGAETIAGAKTFSSDVTVNSATPRLVLDATGTTNAQINIRRGAADKWAFFDDGGGSDDLILARGAGFSETLRFGQSGGLVTLSAGQLKFPATQNASADANTLDDYEEGTWTPSLGGSATYNQQSGHYTKTGRAVCATCVLIISSIGSGSTTTISGLPFSLLSSSSGSLAVSFFTNSATSIVYIGADIAGTQIALLSSTAAAANLGGNSIFQNSTQIKMGGSYQT